MPVTGSWNTYWEGPHANAAYSSGGAGHPGILSFWSDYFRELQVREDSPRIVDIASGNGAVVGYAKIAFDEQLPEFTCLDVSSAAIDMLKSRFPDVDGIVADANTIPLESGAYDVAASQFGLEYAGLDALEEVVRLLSDNGELVLMLHHRGGSIFEHCNANLEAIRELQISRFIPLCIAMFDTGFASLKSGDRSDYSAAEKNLAPAITAMEAIFAKHGMDIADGTVVGLYRDVRDMHSRLRHYEPDEVGGWLSKMQGEVDAYEGRMASMCDAAIDAAAFDALRLSISDKGLAIIKGEALEISGDQLPIAWILIARK